MKTVTFEQGSYEWWQLKKGKISGTRFGQVISGRRNGLLYELLDERLNNELFPDDFTSDDMQFGIDNEPVACAMYEKQSGIKFNRIGAIESDFSDIHMASPDRISEDGSIVLEVKCTQHGHTQIKRFFNGVDTDYMPQILNYFAVSDDVKQVHWVSYCPNRPERPLVVRIFDRDTVIDTVKATKTQPEQSVTIQDRVIEGRTRIAQIEKELNEMEQQFTF